jgi:hypothetical protein
MKSVGTKKKLSPKEREELLGALKARFEKNMNRHKALEWAKVQAKLEANAEKLWSLGEMEKTGGEPDLIVHRKVPKAALVFVTTVKRWIPGKNISRKTAPWIWQRPWASSF